MHTVRGPESPRILKTEKLHSLNLSFLSKKKVRPRELESGSQSISEVPCWKAQLSGLLTTHSMLCITSSLPMVLTVFWTQCPVPDERQMLSPEHHTRITFFSCTDIISYIM
jgi:hypothetical protein